MPTGKIFWLAAGLTVLFMLLYIFGYGSIEIVMTLIIVDMVMLKLLHEKLGKDLGNQLMGEVNTRLSSVMDEMTNFMKDPAHIGPAPEAVEATLGGIERTLVEHRDEVRQEFNDSLDRMAKKAIDIENKLNSAVKNFSSAIGAFDDRIRSLESDGTEAIALQTNGGEPEAPENVGTPAAEEAKEDSNYMELSF